MDATPGLRERKKLETRRNIEAAALALFVERGFAGTTMADIAREADVSLRTVAVHYPTKQDLVFGDHDQDLAALVDRIEQRPAGVATLDALHDWVRTEIIAEKTNPSSIRAMCGQVIHSDPDLLSRARGSLVTLLPVIAAEIARDLGVPADHATPLLAASATIGMFTLLSEGQPHEPGDPELAEAMIAQVFDFLRAGLAALPDS